MNDSGVPIRIQEDRSPAPVRWGRRLPPRPTKLKCARTFPSR